MTFSKQTPLTAVRGLAGEQVSRLNARWIESAEEFLACEVAERDSLPADDEAIAAVVDADFRRTLAAYRAPERALGLMITDSDVAELEAARVRRLRDGSPRSVAASPAEGPSLPSEVRLMDRMLPIRDQQRRGTCAAFASVALCEFALKAREHLSPQFLYWACKERDGMPHEDGTLLVTVQETLFDAGICAEKLWPYCPTVKYVGTGRMLDAGQGPAPEAAVDEARRQLLRCRALTPGAVGKYRELLAAGQPVVIGVFVFKSWMINPVTAMTGKMFMPAERINSEGDVVLEKPCGGHGMCLVGYVDDNQAPGGGYFIVRNSWGENWASRCKEGAGHALMPYAYVENYCLDAFTICGDERQDAPGKEKTSVQDTPPTASVQTPATDPIVVVETLTAECVDVNGIRRSAGTRVVRAGTAVVDMKSGNFKATPFRDALRQQAFGAALPPEIVSARNEFAAKMKDNFSTARMKMSLFPEMASWNAFRIVSGRRIWRSDCVADFSEALRDALAKDALNGVTGMNLPPYLAGIVGLTPTDAWLDRVKDSVVGRVYRVRSFFPGHSIYAVEAFVTRWSFDVRRGFVPTNATGCEIERVIACAEAAVPKLKGDRRLVFYAIGTGLPAAKGYDASLSGTRVVTVSAPSADLSKWAVRVSPSLTKRKAFRDFCDRLLPVTRDDFVSAVRTIVDGTVRSGTLGSTLSVQEIVSELHKTDAYSEFPYFRRTAVTRALLQLQGENPSAYAVCRVEKPQKDVAIMCPSDMMQTDRRFRSRSRLVNFMIHNTLRLLAGAICTGLLVCKVVWLRDQPLWAVCCAVLAVWLVGSYVQDKIVALSEIEKE